MESENKQRETELMKRVKIDDTLREKIGHCKSLGYYIYLKDNTKVGNRKLLKAATEKDLVQKIFLYLHGGGFITLRELYPKWKLYRESLFKTPNNRNTINRNECTWKKYYTGETVGKHKEKILASLKIIDIPIYELTPQKLLAWAQELINEIKEKEDTPYFDRKKFERIFCSIIGAMLRYASDELSTDAEGKPAQIIKVNPWEPVLRKLNELNKSTRHSFITPSAISNKLPREIVFSEHDINAIFKWIDTHKMETETGLAVEFAFVTGLRPSEIVGLKVSDLNIQSSLMYIRHAADNNGDKLLKTGNSQRMVPLCEKAKAILEKVDRFNREKGYPGDYVFRSDDSKIGYRLHYFGIRSKLRKLTSKLNIIYRSPNSCRKTLNSLLKAGSDIPDKERIDMFGHTCEVNEKYYSFFTDEPKEIAAMMDQTLRTIDNP